MKILLLEPPKAPSTIGGEDVFLFEPLALEYVAAGVANAHEVRIVDLRLDRDLPRILAEFRPDIVGMGAYTAHVNVVKRLFEEVKSWSPGVLTVVGGHHATVAPEDFRSPFIDLVVVGEGVFVFQAIVDRYERGAPFDGIPGIAMMTGDRRGRGEGRVAIDLDAFPFPARSLTAQYRKHYYCEWMKPLASIRTSKGCPYRCTFCAQWKVAGGRYFKRDPRRILEELAGIEEEYVFFADDESLVDPARLSRLAELIKEAGIHKRYFLYGRSDTIARNPQLLKLWRGIGLERVFVGLEFSRDEDLRYIGKQSTAGDNTQAVRILQDLGIEVYASFIIRPSFTTADFAALREYCRRLKLNFASFAVLTPLPGTDLYQEVGDQLITRNYDHVDFVHTLLPTRLSLEEFYAEYHRLYTRAIPLAKQVSVLGKLPLREIPKTFLKGRRVLGRLKRAHLDYAGPGAGASS